jgi:hypothetical protein
LVQSDMGLVAILMASSTLLSSGDERALMPRAVQLSYDREPDIESCEDSSAFQHHVASRLGYDPFQAGAPVTVEVRLYRAPRADELVGELTVIGGDGTIRSQRRIESRGIDCGELQATLELVLELMLYAPEKATAPPTSVLAPPISATTADAVATEPTASLRLRHPAPQLRAGAFAGFGASPSPNAGLTLGFDLLWKQASLGLEARLDLPSETSLPAGGASRISLLAASLAPCVLWKPFAVCGLMQAGVQRAEGLGLSENNAADTPFAAAGGRLAAGMRLSRTVGIQLSADVLAPLTRTTVRVGAAPVWTTPPVSTLLGLSVTYALSSAR